MEGIFPVFVEYCERIIFSGFFDKITLVSLNQKYFAFNFAAAKVFCREIEWLSISDNKKTFSLNFSTTCPSECQEKLSEYALSLLFLLFLHLLAFKNEIKYAYFLNVYMMKSTYTCAVKIILKFHLYDIFFGKCVL